MHAPCGSFGHGKVMPRDRSGLQEDVRFRLLRILQDNPQMSQRELAKTVGISLGSLHYVLAALIEKGMVKIGNFSTSPDKRRYAYVLTPRGLTERATLTRRFLERKTAEYDALKTEIEALQRETNPGKDDQPETGTAN